MALLPIFCVARALNIGKIADGGMPPTMRRCTRLTQRIDAYQSSSSMRTVILSVPMLMLTLAFCFPALLKAEPNSGSPDSLVIDSAQVDLLAKTIAISGRNFGDLLPVVNLGATGLEVISSSPTTIKANLPQDLASGSYRLVVLAGGASARFGSLDVTVGDTGPQGPVGPGRDRQGPKVRRGRKVCRRLLAGQGRRSIACRWACSNGLPILACHSAWKAGRLGWPLTEPISG